MTRPQAGFTLLELLISVAIFALLMTVLIGGLQLGTRQARRLTAQIDRSSQVALVEHFLRTRLGAAQPLTAPTSTSRKPQFSGRSDGVDFIAAAPDSVPAGGLQVLSIRLIDSGATDDVQLIVRTRPLRDDPDAPAESQTTVLLDHLRGARFLYYGPERPRDPPDWRDTWQDMAYLPLLIRLSARFDDGEPVPGLAIALRLSSTVAELRLNQGGRF